MIGHSEKIKIKTMNINIEPQSKCTDVDVPNQPTSQSSSGSESSTTPDISGSEANSDIRRLTKSTRRSSVLAKSITSKFPRFDKRLSNRNLHIDYDDEDGKAEFFLLLLFESIEDSALFFAGSILVVFVWSVICAWGGTRLVEYDVANPGGAAEKWVADIENCKSALSIIGTLFVFTLVFRFNACYDRWWESR